MDLMSLDVLCCKITIGDADASNPIVIKNGIEITEVHNIEINDSYKKLIGTAKVSFPKGSVFRSTLIGPITAEGIKATKLTTEVMQDGLVVEKRSVQSLIDDKTFKIGQRINIQMGYNGFLKTMFEGYITAYNSDSMFEIECENMAYILKLTQCPFIETPVKGTKVNDVLGEKYGLLEGTGFELHSDTKKCDIEIGQIKATDNYTVADILSEWSKFKLYCFLKYDANSPSSMPTIAIGRPYSSSKSSPVLPVDVSGPYKIYFNYHIAEDNLKVKKTDPRFLAVTGKALGIDEKFFEVTIRINPEYDASNSSSKKYNEVNVTKISRKTHKVTGNKTLKGADNKSKSDLRTYIRVPYMSPNIGIDFETLKQETIDYFEQYNLNGITGDLTLFGDFGLSTAVQVELIDERNPSKNGIYIVEEVTTRFGVNGYRQKITIPHKVRSTGNGNTE